MKETALAQLRKKFKEERDRDFNIIENAYQAKLKALMVLKDISPDDMSLYAAPTDATVPAFPTNDERRTRTNELKETVVGLVPNLPEEFTINDLLTHLRGAYPGLVAKVSPASLSNVLIRLAEDGTYGFTFKERGKGKRASVYRKTEVAP